MPSKQELFAMAFKVGAFKASKKKNKATKPKQRTGCPTGWTPPKPKPNETFSFSNTTSFRMSEAF